MKFLRNQEEKEQAKAQKFFTLPQIWHELGKGYKKPLGFCGANTSHTLSLYVL